MTTVIVGGGLAGLAAAVRLSRAGKKVTVLESRSFCGGRAYSYTAPVVGDVVDNGQHVMLGCYQALFQYLDIIGSRSQIDIQPQLALPFLNSPSHQGRGLPVRRSFGGGGGGNPTWFRCPRFPAPLHLLAGIAGFCGLRDAWSLLRHRAQLTVDPLAHYVEWDQWSCAEWLMHIGISKNGIHRFWEPLILAVMNDAPARVSAAPFVSALHRIATGSRQDASLAFSRVGLSELLVTPALKYLEDKGSGMRTGVGVAGMAVHEGRIVCLKTSTGEEIPVTRVIFATPPRALVKIVETVPDTIVLREMLGCWDESPILSVYFWYDRPVMDHPMVGLLNSPFHWAFCRRSLIDRHSRESGNPAYGITLVVSGASDFDKMNRDDVTELALTAMHRFFPKSREAHLIHRMVSREPSATVRLAPGTQRLRAAIKSPWANAQFIGDWTDTHLPATIEGAIASGFSVSQSV